MSQWILLLLFDKAFSNKESTISRSGEGAIDWVSVFGLASVHGWGCRMRLSNLRCSSSPGRRLTARIRAGFVIYARI
ncbi:hypothetical protein BKA63DRAFT_501247 [Paraphoma chrysanthemicola]|nr:hypothetical protein BKA63DRAFT_501247 [Paraphoma chrysanthemicola]